MKPTVGDNHPAHSAKSTPHVGPKVAVTGWRHTPLHYRSRIQQGGLAGISVPPEPLPALDSDFLPEHRWALPCSAPPQISSSGSNPAPSNLPRTPWSRSATQSGQDRAIPANREADVQLGQLTGAFPPWTGPLGENIRIAGFYQYLDGQGLFRVAQSDGSSSNHYVGFKSRHRLNLPLSLCRLRSPNRNCGDHLCHHFSRGLTNSASSQGLLEPLLSLRQL